MYKKLQVGDEVVVFFNNHPSIPGELGVIKKINKKKTAIISYRNKSSDEEVKLENLIKVNPKGVSVNITKCDLVKAWNRANSYFPEEANMSPYHPLFQRLSKELGLE